MAKTVTKLSRDEMLEEIAEKFESMDDEDLVENYDSLDLASENHDSDEVELDED